MAKKLHIKKGDEVIVIAGNNKGQKGKVLEVIIDKKRAIVEGVNLISKHTKPNQDNPDGGIIKREAAVNISNLLPVDPKTGKPTRVGRRLNSKGKLVRYAKRSGEELK